MAYPHLDWPIILRISRGEASDYIKMYFERCSGHSRLYGKHTKAFAREHGFVETIFGRKAHYPEIRFAQSANACL